MHLEFELHKLTMELMYYIHYPMLIGMFRFLKRSLTFTGVV